MVRCHVSLYAEQREKDTASTMSPATLLWDNLSAGGLIECDCDLAARAHGNVAYLMERKA